MKVGKFGVEIKMKKIIFAVVAMASIGAFAAVPFKIGVAGYTFHKRTLDETLDIMKKADVHYLCVKDFHLPFSATDADMAAFREKCARFGVTPYAIGPIYVGEAKKLRDEILKLYPDARTHRGRRMSEFLDSGK